MNWSAGSSARRDASASGATRRCCGACAALRWPCCARRSSRSTNARSRGSCPPGRGSTVTCRRALASTACARCWSRCRAWRCRPRCGSATCCRGATGAYSPAWIDQLCAAARSSGSGRARWGAIPAGSSCTSARTCAVLGPPSQRGPGGARPVRRRGLAGARGGACAAGRRARASSPTCWSTSTLSPEEIQEALWDLAWAGEATNDAFAPLRAPRLTLARAQRERVRGAGRPGRFAAPPARRGRVGAGAGSLVVDRAAVPCRGRSERAAAGDRRVDARALRDPDPRAGAGRGRAGGFSGVYPELSQLETLGVARRGYFVEGLGGAQFALPGAVERLRARRRR